MSRRTSSSRSFSGTHLLNKMTAGLTFVLLTVIVMSTQLSAQQSKAKASASDSQTEEGKGLFSQRCAVCHSTATKKYGPMLSKQNVLDREDEIRQQIEQGSAMMPGFQYGLKSAQIDAIIGYLRTVEPPAKKVGTNNNDLPD
jgi:mono/diheme cytochrome c family protein